MIPIFWVLVVIGCVLLWFLLAFIFRPLGKLFCRLWNDAMEEITKDDNDDKSKGEKS